MIYQSSVRILWLYLRPIQYIVRKDKINFVLYNELDYEQYIIVIGKYYNYVKKNINYKIYDLKKSKYVNWIDVIMKL